MEFNKEEIIDSINIEFCNSLKNLIESILSILQESIKENIFISTYKVSKAIPFSRDYDIRPNLYSLVDPKIRYLKEFKQCSEIFNNNELLGSQDIDSSSVLCSFIKNYLDNTDPKSISFDQTYFDYLFEEYKKSLLSFTYEVVYVCPLLGFNSEVDILKLDENLTIRKITEDDLQEIKRHAPFFEYTSFLEKELMNVKYVIEHRIPQIKKSIHKPRANLIPIAVFALRLHKKGKFLANNQLYKNLLPWEIERVNATGESTYIHLISPDEKYFLSKSDVNYLKKYYVLSKCVQNLSEKNYKQLFRAKDWFNRYHNESNTEHRFIFLMFLMEALCSGSPETQYKLSNRISLIIGSDDEDRLFIIKSIKDKEEGLYNIRSAIMHGGSVKLDTNFYNKLEQAEDYSRRLLQKFILISLNEYGIQNAQTLIDNALVSKAKRKELCEALNFDKTFDKFDVEEEKSEPLHSFLKDELYEIKTELNRGRFSVKYANEGFIYKLIVVNGFENTFERSLWDKITEFYDAYFDYLRLLKKSRDRIRYIIRKVIHKIKTEEEAAEWSRKYVEKRKEDSPSILIEPNRKKYDLNNLFGKNPPKNIPEINDKEYLVFDETSREWDLKITLDDLSRSGRSIADILNEIRELFSREELIAELQKSKAQNSKMVSSLIKKF